MNLLTRNLERKIQKDILAPAIRGEYELAVRNMAIILRELYSSIPDNRRASYGRVYTVRVLAGYLFAQLTEKQAPVFETAARLYTISSADLCAGVALGILADYGMIDYQPVLPYIEAAASSQSWELREFAQMFFRRMINRYPAEMQENLLRLVKSEDANLRRFVSETLRPVQENKWFYKKPAYSLTVLRHLFQEDEPYPRTSVGNNLSDLARKAPELVYGLVEELVASGDKNSYWIAYRACRNLVKKEPLRVMDLLQVDHYKYKRALYHRSDYGTR